MDWPRNGAYLAMATAIFAFPLLVGNTFHIHIAQTLLYTTIAVIGPKFDQPNIATKCAAKKTSTR